MGLPLRDDIGQYSEAHLCRGNKVLHGLRRAGSHGKGASCLALGFAWLLQQEVEGVRHQGRQGFRIGGGLRLAVARRAGADVPSLPHSCTNSAQMRSLQLGI